MMKKVNEYFKSLEKKITWLLFMQLIVIISLTFLFLNFKFLNSRIFFVLIFFVMAISIYFFFTVFFIRKNIKAYCKADKSYRGSFFPHIKSDEKPLIGKSQLALKGFSISDISFLSRIKNFFFPGRKKIAQIQDQLIQAGKLAAIGELTAGIAHELSNPIGGIFGYVQFLLEKMEKDSFGKGENDIESIKSYLKFIESEVIRCRRIIKNLLQFSRTAQIQMADVDVNVILSDALKIVEYQMRIDQVAFKKEFDSSIHLIQGDAVQLQQVFINILINAIKAIGPGNKGEIEVSSNYYEHPQRVVEVKIKDNGCGIFPDNIDKIFDPFYTTRPHGEGTGLGLSLSYGIIKSHKGEIRVESEPGVGSVFKILLPAIVRKN